MWFHLFTSNSGGVRVPSLQRHFMQNNDFTKMLLPETYLPQHQRLRFFHRILRFLIAVPVMLLMAVAVLNSVNEQTTYDLCLRRNECLAYCQLDVFPELTCGGNPGISLTYKGNEYSNFYVYPYKSTEGYTVCKGYLEDNDGFEDSVKEDRQWRVHTCFDYCNTHEDNNFEQDGRPLCTNNNDLLCVKPSDDCEQNLWADEECSEDNNETCWSVTVILLAVLIGNIGQLVFEAGLYYTRSISFKFTDLDTKNRKEESLCSDKEPPCSKIMKKCAGEMVAFLAMSSAILVLAIFLVASYRYGRPRTIWFEWAIALLLDQAKSVVIQPMIWWVVVRRCGQISPNFKYWKLNDEIMEGIDDPSYLDEIRQQVSSFLESKPVTYFIIGMVVFYAVFILANLSLDPYIEGHQNIEDFFYYADLGLLVLFVAEIILRFFAWTFDYLFEIWNFVDAVVVIVSFIFSVIRLEVKGIAVLRLLRLIRVVIVMRRVSESKKKLMQLRNQSTSVSSNVTRVLDVLEEIQKDKSILRNLKQDLA